MAIARTQREIRQRAPLLLIGLLLGCFALMAFDARENGDATKQHVVRTWAQAIAAPFQRLTSGVSGTGFGFFKRLGDLRHASAENESLKQQLEQAQIELSQTRLAADENTRLKALLDLKEKSEYGTVMAHVIARDPSLWFDTVTINRGRMSGIELNMPVVTPGGIVGRVVGTGPWVSQVMLITDERAAAGAIVGQLGQSNALGSVRGLGESGLVEMRYVSGLEKVDVGDYVVTTGQDGIYPAGLNVGQVVEVRHGSATSPHIIRIKPGSRLDSLEEVAVLQYKPPQRTAPDQTLPNVEKK
jgi:rod shape-determining protein MreC